MFSGWDQGLRELVRVTRPGGHIVVTAWVQGEDGGVAYLMKRVLERTCPGRKLWPDDFFPRWSHDSFVQALRSAGCAEVSVRVCCSAWTQPSATGVMAECEPILRLFPGNAADGRGAIPVCASRSMPPWRSTPARTGSSACRRSPT